MIRSTKNIFYQSLPALIIASSLSSLGGISLTIVRERILFILPLLILFPALNDMVGDYGTILASKFTTWLYRGTIPPHWHQSRRLRNLVKNIFLIALFYSFLISFLAILISYFQGFSLTASLCLKVFLIAVLTTVSLVALLSILIFTLGTLFYRQGYDPDNSLIPFATSLADFGALLIFGLLIHFLF